MTDSACIANEPLKTLLQKTVVQSREIYATSDTVAVNESSIGNTVWMDRVTHAPYNACSNDRANRGSDMPIENHRTDEDRTKENDACVVG